MARGLFGTSGVHIAEVVAENKFGGLVVHTEIDIDCSRYYEGRGTIAKPFWFLRPQ